MEERADTMEEHAGGQLRPLIMRGRVDLLWNLGKLVLLHYQIAYSNRRWFVARDLCTLPKGVLADPIWNNRQVQRLRPQHAPRRTVAKGTQEVQPQANAPRRDYGGCPQVPPIKPYSQHDIRRSFSLYSLSFCKLE